MGFPESFPTTKEVNNSPVAVSPVSSLFFDTQRRQVGASNSSQTGFLRFTATALDLGFPKEMGPHCTENCLGSSRAAPPPYILATAILWGFPQR